MKEMTRQTSRRAARRGGIQPRPAAPASRVHACGPTNIVMSFDRMGRRVEYLETVASDAGGSQLVATNVHHRFVYEITAAQAGRARRALQAERTERSDEAPREPRYLCIQRIHGATKNVKLIFTWDPLETVATKPLMVEKPGSYKMHVTHDGNKNVSELVFFSGGSGIAAHYEYAPFGAETVSTRGTSVADYDFRTYNPFRFSSEYADDALGLVYYNYRHYNPADGRWMSRDCVLLVPGGKYAFLNNRFSNTDRFGLYDEHVHFYFIYGYMREHGWTHEDALEVAYGSEYPDTGKWSATPGGLFDTLLKIITADSNETREWKLNDATFHNFNGLSADGIEKYRECIRTKISMLKYCECPFSVGLLLHALGDTYAHLQSSGNAYGNCNRSGHAVDLKDPDDVRRAIAIYDPVRRDNQGNPVVTGWLEVGQSRFLGFINDLDNLNLGTSTGNATLSLKELKDKIYAPNLGWKQFLGHYEYDATDLLDDYGKQFGGLDFIGEKGIDGYVLSSLDKTCLDVEAENVREMLIDCLVTAGWRGVE